MTQAEIRRRIQALDATFSALESERLKADYDRQQEIAEKQDQIVETVERLRGRLRTGSR